MGVKAAPGAKKADRLCCTRPNALTPTLTDEPSTVELVQEVPLTWSPCGVGLDGRVSGTWALLLTGVPSRFPCLAT